MYSSSGEWVGGGQVGGSEVKLTDASVRMEWNGWLDGVQWDPGVNIRTFWGGG